MTLTSHIAASLHQILSRIPPTQASRRASSSRGTKSLTLPLQGEGCVVNLWQSQPRRLRESKIFCFVGCLCSRSFPGLSRRPRPLVISRVYPHPRRHNFCQQHPSPLPNRRRHSQPAAMSAYTSPGNSYPHASIHGPGGGGSNDPPLATHHGRPAASQSYPYDPQSTPQLQSPYSNGHTNGHGGDAQQVVPSPAPASATGGEAQKGNRLRKACDSCSIRKVKVAIHCPHSHFVCNRS